MGRFGGFKRMPLRALQAERAAVLAGCDDAAVADDVQARGLQADGVLRIPFTSAYRKKQFRDGRGIPTAYSEIGLETSHRTDTSLWCELTFWAVQLLHLVGQAEGV